MERVAHYQAIIRDIVCRHASIRHSAEGVITSPFFDDEHGHYGVLWSGWQGRQRIHAMHLHISVRDGKVWIEFDGTHDGVAEELVQAGIPRGDIVLAWIPESRRKDTDYAVA